MKSATAIATYSAIALHRSPALCKRQFKPFHPAPLNPATCHIRRVVDPRSPLITPRQEKRAGDKPYFASLKTTTRFFGLPVARIA
jgi:hypothetical protein